jgi:hypothetical protein
MAATKYHRGYTREQALAARRKSKSEWKQRDSLDKIRNREVIVWDGEGMKLSGDDRPQHYVLFGCSARPNSPLVIRSPHGRLAFDEIADYCLDIAAEHPDALHLGYYFKYDQNMIIYTIPWPAKQVLYSKGACMVRRGKTKYYVRIIFGKSIRITRVNAREEKVSMVIEDFAPFFATSFVKAYESLFKASERSAQWVTVVEGKRDRSIMLYADMAKVERYWRAEILALQELAFEFRRLMFDAGFMLNQWHGPGALANYIRRTNDLTRHEYGGKEENLPNAVHLAVKGAYYGGHFEQYRVGFVAGPVHSYDINSAYPAGFCEVPTLQEGGFWANVGPIARGQWDRKVSTSFGVFYVRWKGYSNASSPLGNSFPQPLPHRDSKGNISYPRETEGWYWAPEVAVAMNLAQSHPDIECDILDGWVWYPADEECWPWESLLQDMYARRLVLKNNNNPSQMAFKLGPNSLYGKYAQRAGGKDKAPASHTLCIAGYVTSQCRAKIMRFVHACKPGSVVSIETDGVFTTTAPDELTGAHRFPLTKKLGDWDYTRYDNMILLQNGVYLRQKDGEWIAPKTRGIAPHHFQNERGETDIRPIMDHLAACEIDTRWKAMQFDGGESFIGLGAAIARATRRTVSGKWSTNPFKASDLHCSWYPDGKTIDLEGKKSKRAHHYQFCPACRRGVTPDKTWHTMVINSAADLKPLEERKSTAYELPWEKGYTERQWEIMERAEGMALAGDEMA